MSPVGTCPRVAVCACHDAGSSFSVGERCVNTWVKSRAHRRGRRYVLVLSVRGGRAAPGGCAVGRGSGPGSHGPDGSQRTSRLHGRARAHLQGILGSRATPTAGADGKRRRRALWKCTRSLALVSRPAGG